MKVLEFGNTFSKVEKFEYLSSKTFLEFDLIFFNIEVILKNSHSIDFSEYAKRKNHLEDFITLKNTPLIFFTPVETLFNAKINNTLVSRSLSAFVPTPDIKVEKQSGSMIEIEPNSLFTDFMQKYKQHFKYESYFTFNSGNKIAFTPLKNQILAFWNDDCVFLPPVSIPTINEKDFFDDLYLVIKRVRNAQQQSVLPEWTEKYFLPDEKIKTEKISLITTKIKSLNEELENEIKQYEFLTQKKSLFVASGPELEDHIENLLKEIGFKILETETNREDLIIEYEDKVAVVEIKGVTGSSAEKHAAQLEKWSAEFFERTEKKPKPILIVNAFKDKPLTERKADVFPNQMLKYSISRDHCLISTLQLLGLYYYVQNHPSELDKQIEKIFSTIGIYEEFTEWDNFISYASE
jgi:hypothetical protein